MENRAAAFVTVRGAVSIMVQHKQFIVDGAFVDGSEASALSSNDIESVSVLKDGASLSMECVENGVIVITTKKVKMQKQIFI
jgi:hypothetical protein